MAHATSDAVLVTLLLGPIAIYLIGTQRLREVSGPGGISIKITEAIRKDRQIGKQMIWPSVDQLWQIRKGGLRALEQTLRDLDPEKPTALILPTTRDHHIEYDQPTLAEYLRQLRMYRGFKLVIFLDDRERFQAAIDPIALIEMLRSDMGEYFVASVNEGLFANTDDPLFAAHAKRQFPALVTDFCTPDHTNAEVLSIMRDRDLDVLVVADKVSRGVLDIVERNQIVSTLLLAAESDEDHQS